ncbi:hypothetical protein M569_15831 [Genlisea aurea]|uniref:Uncharacterized protein n=1 Tax=Genlisea aurea TaxID=192259 RepID=S8C3M7_9LAMI|nr:hypothetical protein M569_15831 [Genlisea aurea]
MTDPNRRRNEAFVIIAAHYARFIVLLISSAAYLLIRSERGVRRKSKRNADASNSALLEEIRGIVKEVTDSFEQAVSRLNDDDTVTTVARILNGFAEPLTAAELLRVCDEFGSNRAMMHLFLMLDGAGRVEMVNEIVTKP